jgi:hypothetical protein
MELYQSADYGSDPDTVSDSIAIRLIRAAGRDLTNPQTLLKLIRRGVRFQLFNFIREISLTQEQLEQTFPLLDFTLWSSRSPFFCLSLLTYLHELGHRRVVSWILRLRPVLQYYRHLFSSTNEVLPEYLFEVLDSDYLLMLLRIQHRDSGETLLQRVLNQEQCFPMLLKRHPLTLSNELDWIIAPSCLRSSVNERRLYTAVQDADVQGTLQLLRNSPRKEPNEDALIRMPFSYATQPFLKELLRCSVAEHILSDSEMSARLVTEIVRAKHADGIFLLLENADLFPPSAIRRHRPPRLGVQSPGHERAL